MNSFGQTTMTTTILENGYKFTGSDELITGMYELLKRIEGKTVVRFEFPPMRGGNGNEIFVELSPFGSKDLKKWEDQTSKLAVNFVEETNLRGHI